MMHMQVVGPRIGKQQENSTASMLTSSIVLQEVEAFIEENELNERAGEALRGANPTNLSILSAETKSVEMRCNACSAVPRLGAGGQIFFG